MAKAQHLGTLLVVILGLFFVSACSDGDSNNSGPKAALLPIVFVHGQSGSAQQFETQAMRFTSNDYPQALLFAFEYDTDQEDNPLADLDAFLDRVLAETGAREVYAIGHSRGTSVWTSYLEDPAFNGPAKVAKYVNIDGRSPAELPGGVPTIGIWGEWNTANSGYNRRADNSNAQIGPEPANNHYFADKSHTETATSAEAFALMYQFLLGRAAKTTDLLIADADQVAVAGRAVYFPQNRGFAGATLQLWQIDPATGQRGTDTPAATVQIGSSGDFGPLQLNKNAYYEFALLRGPTEAEPLATVHHFYPEPFIRDDYFFRLNSSEPGGGIEGFIPAEESATGMVIQRQREFWGDQGARGDEIFIDGLSVLTPEISPRTGVNLALFLFDPDRDQTTDLDKGEIFPFNLLTFLTGADVFIPAQYEGAGTIQVGLVTRGGGETILNIPNWPSSTNRISVMFRDDTP